MNSIRRRATRLALAAWTVAMLPGCGFGSLGHISYGYGSSSSDTSAGGGLGLGLGCLEATNASEVGGPRVVRIDFLDPVTGEARFQAEVDIAPGEKFDVMDVPAGPYRLVAWFGDGFVTPPMPPAQGPVGEPIRVSPDLEAAVAFRHD